jgi:hypothetical protein
MNYNCAFLKHAGITPSDVDTCHVSVACDMKQVELIVHWRVERARRVEHFSKTICNYRIRVLDGDNPPVDMEQFHARMHNILGWTLGDRLKLFQTAIANLATGSEDENPDEATED